MDHPNDHPRDRINVDDPHEVLPTELLDESVREVASTSKSPDIQAPSLSRDTPAFQVPSHSQPKDILPQLTAEQKEELMRLHTELTQNPVKEVISFEFEEPRDQTDVYHAIFKEPQVVSDDGKSISEEESDQEEWTPKWKSKQGRSKSKVKKKYTKRNSANWGKLSQDKADIHDANWGEPQGVSDDGKSISEEKSDQEEWTPKGKSKQGRSKSKVKKKYTKQNSANWGEPSQDKADIHDANWGEPQGVFDDGKSISEEESDQEEWTPKWKSKQGRSKSKVKRKYTKQNSANWGEPSQDKADIHNANWREPQGVSDDGKSISEEESDQEEWTPKWKSKQGRSKSKVKRKYTKQNSANWGEPSQDKADIHDANWREPQGVSDDGKSISEEESDQEEWTPKGKNKQGRSKSKVKRKYTKRNSAKRTQDIEGSERE